ncbi:MAG: peptide-methionine (S)-S-oxide reductase MsrA [Bryobacteraceae bacterium]|nr:peptide-methionine (S)-S-oxide reductase MsrA [Bryobacteraceae bacterium]
MGSEPACNVRETAKDDGFPNPEIDIKAAGSGKETAVIAGGCFWCTEAVFEQLQGVEDVISGYAGGTARTAHYEVVSGGGTDHAESIQIVYDPSRISFGQLLKVFFSVAHDPTQKDRQGPDRGRQYRSAIFYKGEEEKRVAEAYIAQLDAAKAFPKPIVTEVVPLNEFFPAEDYHQDFARANPRQGYVMMNALPKVDKVKKKFPDKVK